MTVYNNTAHQVFYHITKLVDAKWTQSVQTPNPVGETGAKLSTFLKYFSSAFNDLIYLIAFKCIMHCQVLATTWEEEIQA